MQPVACGLGRTLAPPGHGILGAGTGARCPAQGILGLTASIVGAIAWYLILMG